MGWTIYNYHSFDELLKLLEQEDTQMSLAKELKKLADAENDRRNEDLRKLSTENFLNDLKKEMLALAKKGLYLHRFYSSSNVNFQTVRDRLNDWGLRVMQMTPRDNGYHFEVSWS